MGDRFGSGKAYSENKSEQACGGRKKWENLLSRLAELSNRTGTRIPFSRFSSSTAGQANHHSVTALTVRNALGPEGEVQTWEPEEGGRPSRWGRRVGGAPSREGAESGGRRVGGGCRVGGQTGEQQRKSGKGREREERGRGVGGQTGEGRAKKH